MAAAATQKKALDAKKAVVKGSNSKKLIKVRSSVNFHRPKTLKLARTPKYQRKSISHYARLDAYKVVKSHVNSEVSIKKIEDANTLVLTVDNKATKTDIKNAVKTLYNVDALKINTLVRADGAKKAFVKLTPEHDALDVASRVGYI
ncbi:60S ribosomal protein uL23 [Magnusiomyces paraingens]|uniref:Large ribosomal subunit protein uL23 N-terminal domain-containing protein n=1 Tax=Magnusiomyces paraingens TaxID=2606893 RepID=A0A5E8AYY2_9ASCO|nr:uncharacterized protein SAPINGB_P000241 [Saprochaete ingens]VVT43978.1 unnamed protein product [Saprochaete ingens]